MVAGINGIEGGGILHTVIGMGCSGNDGDTPTVWEGMGMGYDIMGG